MSDKQHIQAGIEKFNSGNYQAVIDHFKEYPDHVIALYWSASASMRLQDLDNAMQKLNKAISIYDEYADAYSQRGVVHFHKGSLESALEDMDKAVELEPDNPYRYSSRAYIKGNLKQVHSAIEDYKKAIKLDPEDSIAYNNLGLLEEQLGYEALAKKRFEKADSLSVNSNGELVEKSEAKATKHSIPEPPKRVVQTPTSLFGTLKSVLTSKEGFNEYWAFIKKQFK